MAKGTMGTTTSALAVGGGVPPATRKAETEFGMEPIGQK
jgi:hypothetical protein